MKKFIALSFSIIFILLSVTACGETTDNPSSSSADSSGDNITLVSVDVDFKKHEKGALDYTTLSEFTVKADEAYQCMSEEYLYLPTGAVLSSDKDFGIHCFNDSFGINQFIMSGAGQSLEGYNPILKSGSLTIKSGCYVRITVKGALTDVKIEVPSDFKDLVVCATKEALELQPKIKVVNEFLSGSKEAVSYLFITDIHYGSSVDDLDGDGIRIYNTLEEVEKRLNNLLGYVNNVVTIANNSPYIDFVVVGGDIVNGYETPDSPNFKESKKKNPNITVSKHVISQLQQILAPLKNCEKPIFILSGNHDDNVGHSIYRGNDPSQVQSIESWLVSDLDWDKGVLSEFVNVDIVRDKDYSYNGKSISKYYYYDLKKNGKTTRILCLDYNDDRYTFDSKGEVTALPNWGLYHEGQIKWLAEVGLQGDFDECLVFSHANMSAEQKVIATTSAGDLELLIEAYQTKTRFKQSGSYTVSVDFANRTSGDIVSYHHGHEHEHKHSFDYKKRFWTLSTAMAVETIDIISVTPNSIFKRELDNILISELLRNGSERSSVQ